MDPHLPPLLRYCRDLGSARNELRWLKEHACTLASAKTLRNSPSYQLAGLGNHNEKNGVPGRWSQPVDYEETTDLLRTSSISTGRHNAEEKSATTTADRGSEVLIEQSHKQDNTLQKSQLEEGLLRLQKKLLARMVHQRSHGKPLQYILGNQPFGNLEIECRKGVLIPRPETETYTEHVAQVLSRLVLDLEKRPQTNFSQRKRVRILDLCSGTGCIALLLHSLLKPPPGSHPSYPISSTNGLGIEVLGLDISDRAVSLAQLNLSNNIEKGLLHPAACTDIRFATCDIRDVDGVSGKLFIETVVQEDGTTQAHFRSKPKDQEAIDTSWDIVISNPPYISEREFIGSGVVERSVRRYEPRLALIPPNDEHEEALPSQPDLFYRLLLSIASKLDAPLLIMEVGDTEQANRVLRLVSKRISPGNTQPLLLESWQDDGSVKRYPFTENSRSDVVEENSPKEKEKETGSAGEDVSDRVVVCWRDGWARWRLESYEPPIAS